MGIVTFDYKCPVCGHVEERTVRRADIDKQTHCHPDVTMVRLPAGTKTTFKFADASGIKR